MCPHWIRCIMTTMTDPALSPRSSGPAPLAAATGVGLRRWLASSLTQHDHFSAYFEPLIQLFLPHWSTAGWRARVLEVRYGARGMCIHWCCVRLKAGRVFQAGQYVEISAETGWPPGQPDLQHFILSRLFCPYRTDWADHPRTGSGTYYALVTSAFCRWWTGNSVSGTGGFYCQSERCSLAADCRWQWHHTFPFAVAATAAWGLCAPGAVVVFCPPCTALSVPWRIRPSAAGYAAVQSDTAEQRRSWLYQCRAYPWILPGLLRPRHYDLWPDADDSGRACRTGWAGCWSGADSVLNILVRHPLICSVPMPVTRWWPLNVRQLMPTLPLNRHRHSLRSQNRPDLNPSVVAVLASAISASAKRKAGWCLTPKPVPIPIPAAKIFSCVFRLPPATWFWICEANNDNKYSISRNPVKFWTGN